MLRVLRVDISNAYISASIFVRQKNTFSSTMTYIYLYLLCTPPHCSVEINVFELEMCSLAQEGERAGWSIFLHKNQLIVHKFTALLALSVSLLLASVSFLSSSVSFLLLSLPFLFLLSNLALYCAVGLNAFDLKSSKPSIHQKMHAL